MGYYTCFTIEYDGEEADIKKVEEDFKALYKEWNEGYLDELIDTGSSERKWYEWEDDMRKVAKNNPNVLIILHGNGEESDDIWQARAKGDEYEFQSFCLPPFQNPNLFTEDEKKVINQLSNK